MSQLFGDKKLTLACLKCGDKFQETIARLEAHPKYTHTCVRCGTVSEFDTRQFKSKLADVDKSVEKLRQTIRKFGK